MDVSFLTPASGTLALGAVLPIVFLIEGERRAGIVRAALRLSEPPATRRGLLVASLVAVPVLLGVAAMQPVIDVEKQHVSRTDAEVYFVLDTSRSMLARATADTETRFERARDAAIRVRARVGEIPAGIASMTDRVLPHMFPSPDGQVFAATLERAVGIDRPPPVDFNPTATTLGALASLATHNYYTPGIPKRVAVVFTDAETRPFAAESLGAIFRRPPPVELIFVRVGDAEERVYLSDGSVETEYRPDPEAERTAQTLAEASGGSAFEEDELDRVVDAIRAAAGRGKTEVRGDERTNVALAPYTVALALLPLGLVLWRRNL